ncbi:MAG: hypothetical protein PUG85_02835 [Oscillospiraceae bacterium]|nr:hypothetical protein [Oscillospiraceae bacterium]MDY2510319.1 hypothetical protein [Ruminococcus callidus]
MLFEKAQQKMMNATLAMQEKAMDRVVQEQYKAAIEIYLQQIQLNQELAHKFLENHQEEQKKIFEQAMIVIDMGIDGRNPDLVQSALVLIKTMRQNEPEFFNRYYKIRFGRSL